MNAEYWLVFEPKPGIVTKPEAEAGTLDRRYRIKLPGDPRDNPQLIQDAIKGFESYHQVKNWKELAFAYHTETSNLP
jgi:hypothetical protein